MHEIGCSCQLRTEQRLAICRLTLSRDGGCPLDVLVTVEQRYCRTPDGRVWTPGQFVYSFWTRYLAVFDHVRVVARVMDVPVPAADWARVDGPSVSVYPLPYYVGPLQYVRNIGKIRKAIRAVLAYGDSIILRVPSPIASAILPFVWAARRPYALEVVGDPFDVFAPGAIRHPLRPFFRWKMSRELRRQCRRANAVSYVTEYTLQKRYPPSLGAFVTHYSSVELPDEAFAINSRHYHTVPSPARLISVGSLQTLNKAPDILIRAVALLNQREVNTELVWVGDGQHRSEMEVLARRLGVADRVRFLGQLPSGQPVWEQLDSADLFVLPSRAEGLPRAMIEAMARGLPCIGTTAGGIPELLSADDTVAPNNAEALAEKITEVLSRAQRLTTMSERNLSRAQSYRATVLEARRRELYEAIQEQTLLWSGSSRQAEGKICP